MGDCTTVCTTHSIAWHSRMAVRVTGRIGRSAEIRLGDGTEWRGFVWDPRRRCPYDQRTEDERNARLWPSTRWGGKLVGGNSIKAHTTTSTSPHIRRSQGRSARVAEMVSAHKWLMARRRHVCSRGKLGTQDPHRVDTISILARVRRCLDCWTSFLFTVKEYLQPLSILLQNQTAQPVGASTNVKAHS